MKYINFHDPSGITFFRKEAVMRILRGSSLELYELQGEHLPVLFEWRNSDDFMRSCSTRRNSVSFDEFRSELARDLNKDRDLQFILVRKGEPIGTIYSYKLNRTDEHVFVTVFLVSRWRKKGYGAEALAIFAEFLFREFELYKIYAEVYSYNVESLKALRSGKFVAEGRFRGHRFYNDERHDLVRFAFFRTQLLAFAPFLKRLTGRDPNDWI